MKLFILSVLTTFCLMGEALSHPTSFEGSKGVMGYHMPSMSHIQVNYSWRYWWATGAHHIRQPNSIKNREATLASLNFLVHRWNTEHLQANLYAVVGAGQSNFTGEDESVQYGLTQFDIEDRDYYFLAKHSQMGGDSITHLRQTIIRAGVTPYVDPYNGFHTWIIAEWSKTESLKQESIEGLTPFLRFFYRNILFEFGQSLDGQTKFNYITHF